MVYASRLLNRVEQNHNTTHKETLAMVFVLHKFKIICWVVSLSFMWII
jgi:hypothetical protein